MKVKTSTIGNITKTAIGVLAIAATLWVGKADAQTYNMNCGDGVQATATLTDIGFTAAVGVDSFATSLPSDVRTLQNGETLALQNALSESGTVATFAATSAMAQQGIFNVTIMDGTRVQFAATCVAYKVTA